MAKMEVLHLTPTERGELHAGLRSRKLPSSVAQRPPDESTHWSLRKMAGVMKVNKNLIARIWKEADLKPSSRTLLGFE